MMGPLRSTSSTCSPRALRGLLLRSWVVCAPACAGHPSKRVHSRQRRWFSPYQAHNHFRSPASFHRKAKLPPERFRPDGPCEFWSLPSFKCSQCSKRFVRKGAVDKHEEMEHKRELRCKICDKTFNSKVNFKHHLMYHEQLANAEAKECPQCGDTFDNEMSLVLHLAKMPKDHGAIDSIRAQEFTREDLHSDTFFQKHSPVLGPYLEHVTSEAFKPEIDRTKFLQAETLESGNEFIGSLSQPNAPKCAYFLLTPASDMMSTIVSRFPLSAEGEEICAKLMVNLDDLFATEQFKLFCCGLTQPRSGRTFTSVTRAVVLLARPHEWGEAAKYGVEMDLHDNRLFYRDRESGVFHMATENDERQLTTVVAVMNGVSLSKAEYRWKEAVKVLFNDVSMICPLCDFSSHGIQMVANHIVSIHEGHKFQCRFCSQKFVDRTYMEGHEKDVHGDEKLTCEVCNVNFKSRSGLRRHVAVTHEGKRLKCKECHKEFSDVVYLNQHIKVIHQGFRYKCPEEGCTMNFTTANSLSNHVKQVHRGIRHKCTECDQTFTWRSSMVIHRRIEHEKRRYQCSECSLSFSRGPTLANHMKQVHRGIVNQCKHCSYKNPSKPELNNHVTVDHGGIFYACEVCSYVCRRSAALRDHDLIQHKGRRYQCGVCKEMLTCQKALGAHHDTHHPKEPRSFEVQWTTPTAPESMELRDIRYEARLRSLM